MNPQTSPTRSPAKTAPPAIDAKSHLQGVTLESGAPPPPVTQRRTQLGLWFPFTVCGGSLLLVGGLGFALVSGLMGQVRTDPVPASTPDEVPAVTTKAPAGQASGVAAAPPAPKDPGRVEGDTSSDAEGPSANKSADAVDVTATHEPSNAESTQNIPKLDLSSIVDVDGSLAKAPTCAEALGKHQVAPSDDAAAVERIVEQAEAALRNGKDKISHTLICKALAMDEKSALATLGLARVLLARRDAKAAAEHAQSAAELPGAPVAEVRAVLGDAVVRLGNEQAARLLWAGKNGQSPDLESMREDAMLAYRTKDYHRAERLYRRVLTFDPTDDKARRQLALSLERLRVFGAAAYWAKAPK